MLTGYNKTMHGFMGSDLLDEHWRVDKYPDFADITLMHDLGREHVLGDECWCNPAVYRPTCGQCGQQHFIIVVHKPENKTIPMFAAKTCVDNLIIAVAS